MVFGLAKLGHVDVSLDSILVECALQHFVVLDELVLVLGLPLHFGVGEGVGKEGVHDPAVDGGCGALLDLLYL